VYCCCGNVRDQQIERLTWEVNQLRRELARVKAEDLMVIESLHNRVHELEMELNDLRQIAESTTTVSLHIVNSNNLSITTFSLSNQLQDHLHQTTYSNQVR